MAEHGSGNSNPVGNLFGMVISSVTGIYGAIFVVGGVVALATGNVPVRGSLLNPWETGQYCGGLVYAGLNSGVQTFGDEKYFQNSKKIGSDTKPEQRLMSPQRELSNKVLPTGLKATSDSNVLDRKEQTSFAYEDSNSDGVISPEEIAAQNKARSQ
jgi:hypothetical protein